MEPADKADTYDEANTEPTATPDELKLWWYRGTAKYFPYRVKRVSERSADGLRFLTFTLVRNEGLGNFEVELTRQTDHVWSDLPSTAQRASAERPYGFLMLSDAWELAMEKKLAAQNKPVKLAQLREGGGKWPFSAEGEAENFVAALNAALKDEATKTKLRKLFDGLADSIR